MFCSTMSRFGFVVALAAATLAACGGTDAPTVMQSNTATSGPAPTTTVESVATSTTPVDTTVVDTTTPTTVAVTIAGPTLTAAELVLSADGIGPLLFGDAGDSTIGVREVSDGAPVLLTATGITLGSVWADFEDVTSVWGGCYFTAYGETSGVQLQLSATTGELFAPTFFETDSTEVFVQPGPEVMAVEFLSAGENTRSIIGDCPG